MGIDTGIFGLVKIQYIFSLVISSRLYLVHGHVFSCTCLSSLILVEGFNLYREELPHKAFVKDLFCCSGLQSGLLVPKTGSNSNKNNIIQCNTEAIVIYSRFLIVQRGGEMLAALVILLEVQRTPPFMSSNRIYTT